MCVCVCVCVCARVCVDDLSIIFDDEFDDVDAENDNEDDMKWML